MHEQNKKFSKETVAIKKILELKNTITELKNSIESFISRLDCAEERSNDPIKCVLAVDRCRTKTACGKPECLPLAVFCFVLFLMRNSLYAYLLFHTPLFWNHINLGSVLLAG